MLITIDEKKLNELNQKNVSDLDVLKNLFQIKEQVQLSRSTQISNYFNNYYNDVKVHILRRDFIDLYPKIDQLEKEWATENLRISNTALLSLSDSSIKSVFSDIARKDNTPEHHLTAIRKLGGLTHNDELINWPITKVSQNSFVNQKTVYNSTFKAILEDIQSTNGIKMNLISEMPLASNDILNTTQLNVAKKWKPSIN